MARTVPFVPDIDGVWQCLFCRAHVRHEDDPKDLARHAEKHKVWCLWRRAWVLAVGDRR